jgi:hypothetical protein
MPVNPHDACEEPRPDTVICRFMNMVKFRDLFANEELYFRRDDLFKKEDNEEGLAPDDYMRDSLRLTKYDLHDELILNHQQAFSRQIAEARYVQCWHIYEGETLEMWRDYAGPDGVAIFCKFGKLRSILDIFIDDVIVGKVKYGDIPARHNLIDFLFMKRKRFAQENELRLVISSYDPVGGVNRHADSNDFPHLEPLDENPLNPWVNDCKRRRIDLNALVSEIRTSPWATDKEIAEVNDWVRGKNMSCLLKPSEKAHELTPTFEECKRHQLS